MELTSLFPLLNSAAIVVFVYLFLTGKILPRSVVDELIKATVKEAVDIAVKTAAVAIKDVAEHAFQEQFLASDKAVTEMAARTIMAVNAMVEENRAILEIQERKLMESA